MSKQFNIKPLAFESHRRRVSAAFDGGPITSDVGPLGVSDPALPRLLGIVADRYPRYSTTSPIPLMMVSPSLACSCNIIASKSRRSRNRATVCFISLSCP